jgi:hypothetical protein
MIHISPMIVPEHVAPECVDASRAVFFQRSMGKSPISADLNASSALGNAGPDFTVTCQSRNHHSLASALDWQLGKVLLTHTALF